ncbi:MAG: hypothetical protein JRJ80_09480 [Deltaproteobacteria bacterium]|nr:hypothetical protein [Deltaproteobacteria bacterium]
MKDQILAGPPPSYQINSVSPGPGAVAAIVRGTWQAPNWRENQYFIARDVNGDPRITGSLTVPFVLTLPQAAASGPVPVVMFQHGSPGSSEQVVWESQLTLAQAGFAVIGFTDTLNRELGQNSDTQSAVLFQALLDNWRFPHFMMQTYGDMMAFLRVIEQLGSLDRLPLPSGDGAPDLDLGLPLTYVGLSMGSVHGSAFLSYAPEIKAAAIAAGALRQGEGYFSGGAFIDDFPPGLAAFLPNANPADYWVGLSILQMGFDHQDPYNHAEFTGRAHSPGRSARSLTSSRSGNPQQSSTRSRARSPATSTRARPPRSTSSCPPASLVSHPRQAARSNLSATSVPKPRLKRNSRGKCSCARQSTKSHRRSWTRCSTDKPNRSVGAQTFPG